jgi:hypothetical protein
LPEATTAVWLVEQLAGYHALHAVLAGDFDAVPTRPTCGLSRLQSLGGVEFVLRDAGTTNPEETGHTF